MSRSYKKHAIVQGGGCKALKRDANKVVRRIALEDVPSGKAYKKAYPTWDIADYKLHAWDERTKTMFKRK
jgi:hypothetical protein